MFGLILLNLISFNHFFTIDENKRDVNLNLTFGFLPGGNYSIEFTDGGNDSFLLMIGLKKDIKYFNENENLYLPCTASIKNKNFHIVHLHNGKSQISGSIEKKGNYHFNIKSCNYFSKGYKLDVKCLNPNSNLSNTQMTYVKATPFIAIISSILLIIWIINWLIHPSFRNILHILLTISFVLFTIDKILMIFAAKSSIHSDSISKWLIAQIYLFSSREFFIILTLSLLILSFEHINNPVKVFWLVLAFILSLIYSISTIFFIYSYKIYEILIIASGSLHTLFFQWIILRFIHNYHENIDMNLWIKLLMLLAEIYILKKLGIIIIYSCFIIVPFSNLIVSDIFDFVILTGIGFILRMTKERKNNYYEFTAMNVDDQNTNNDLNIRLPSHGQTVSNEK